MGWSIIFVAVAAYVAYMYVYIPLAIRSRMKHSADPRIELVSNDDPRFPAEARTFSHEIIAQLAPLGFAPAAQLLHSEPDENTRGYITVATNRSTNDEAAAMAVFAQARGGPMVRTYVLEFCTKFADGTEISTNNGQHVSGIVQPRWRTLHTIPGLADLAQLYRVHQGALARATTAKVPPGPSEKIPEAFRATLLRDWQYLSDHGSLYLETDGRHYRYTVLGSFLRVWPMLWPIKAIRRWLLARKARRLLADAGLPTSYSAVDYAQLVKQRQQENPEPAAPLQFERAEYAVETPALSQTLSCKRCGAAIADHYWESGGAVVCQACRILAEAVSGFGARVGRFSKATFLGLLAAIAGSAIWYGIRVATGYEIGLVAIVVGLMVGVAVKIGSGGRGGWRYQTIAILLTYCAIVGSIVPHVVTAWDENVASPTSAPASAPSATTTPQASTEPAAATEQPEARAKRWEEMSTKGKSLAIAFVFVAMFVAFVPMLIASKDIIELLIIAFALYEAWKINKRSKSSLSGPYSIAAAPPTAGGAPAPPASPAV